MLLYIRNLVAWSLVRRSPPATMFPYVIASSTRGAEALGLCTWQLRTDMSPSRYLLYESYPLVSLRT
jgi:hypothetical protein